jgi:hypothetical protein
MRRVLLIILLLFTGCATKEVAPKAPELNVKLPASWEQQVGLDVATLLKQHRKLRWRPICFAPSDKDSVFSMTIEAELRHSGFKLGCLPPEGNKQGYTFTYSVDPMGDGVIYVAVTLYLSPDNTFQANRLYQVRDGALVAFSGFSVMGG